MMRDVSATQVGGDRQGKCMAKAKINPPERAVTDLKYQPDCQFALEPSVTKLLKLAEEAGWDARQAAYAVMMLAAQAAMEPAAPGIRFDDPGTIS